MSIQFITSNPSARRREELAAEKRKEQQASIYQAQEDRSAQKFADDSAYNEMAYDHYAGIGIENWGNQKASSGSQGAAQATSAPDFSKASINSVQIPGINNKAPAPVVETGGSTQEQYPSGIDTGFKPAQPSTGKMTQEDMARASINSMSKKPVNKRAGGRFLAHLNKLNYERSQDAQRQQNRERQFVNADRNHQLRVDARQDELEREAHRLAAQFGKTRNPADLAYAKYAWKKANMKWDPKNENPSHAYSHNNAMLLAEKLYRDAPQSKIMAAYQAAYKNLAGGGDESTAMDAMQNAVGDVAQSVKPDTMMKAMDAAMDILQDDPDFIDMSVEERTRQAQNLAYRLIGKRPTSAPTGPGGASSPQADQNQMNVNAPSGMPANAKQGRDGNWYAPDPQRPGKWLMLRQKGNQPQNEAPQAQDVSTHKKPVKRGTGLDQFTSGNYARDAFEEISVEIMKGIPREQAVLNVLSQYTLTPEQEADVRQRVASRWASDAEVSSEYSGDLNLR